MYKVLDEQFYTQQNLSKIKEKQTFTDQQKQKKFVVNQFYVVDCVPQKGKLWMWPKEHTQGNWLKNNSKIRKYKLSKNYD